MRHSSLLAIGLVTALVTTSPAAADATPAHPVRDGGDIVTTVDFEAYAPGTQITNQYTGITFEYPTAAAFTLGTPGTGVVSVDTGGPPVVTASGARSGSDAGDMVSPGEFGAAGTFAAFSNLAGSVSVYIGDAAPVSIHVELDAYGANRALLGSDTAVTSGAGAQTLLTYSTGGAGTIAYVAIYRTDHIGGDAVIDDLSFNVPPSAAAVVGVSASTVTYELGPGGTRDIPLTVARLNGATNPATIAVTGLPTGVTSSLSQNPVALPATTSTLTLAAATTVATGNYAIALTASATGATSQPPEDITLSIVAPVQVVAPSSIMVGGCSTHNTTITAQVAPGLSGPVTFAVNITSSSPGLTSALSPVQAAVSEGLAQTTLTIASTGGSASGTVQLTATLAGGGSQTVDIPLQRLGPEVTAIDAMDTSSLGTPVAGLNANTPRAEKPGTTVEVFGQYFCTSATVAFGNPKATVIATVKKTLGSQGPEDYLRVTTPRDATSGPVTVTAGSPPASGTSTASLTVDSYRNADAFNFHNFFPSLNFQDLTDAFGSQQTYINFNPCGILTLGQANCSVPLVPDPVAAAWLGIADAALSGGTCFGIALTDQRLMSRQIDVSLFPGTGPLIYDLNGPKIGSDGTARGNEPLLEVLKAQHLMQFSTEFMSKWLARATAQTIEPPGQVVAGIAQEISAIFAAGRYPMIELNDGNGGGGHVLVAYDLEANGTGGYNIYVYDSNSPYQGSEGTDADGHAHTLVESVIYLQSNGTWALPSTTEPNTNGQPFQGGPSAIVVTDPASIPLHPTLATLGGAAPGLLFSSAGAPGSAGANAAAAAHLTQLTGAGGQTLYGKNGSLNRDAATRLDAAPFGPFVGPGASAARSPQLIVVGPGLNQVQVTARGTTQGGTAETFVDGGFVGTVAASTPKGASGRTSFSAPAGSVGFTGTTSTPLSLEVNRVTASGSQSVLVTTSGAKGGSDMLMLGAGGGAITLARRGPATTFTMTLSGESHNELPGTFTTGAISIGPGQTASISGIHWTSLAGASLTARVGGKSWKLRNRTAAFRLVNIGQVQELPGTHQHVRLVVTGSLAKLAGGSDVAVVWVVRHGKSVLAQHEVALQVQHGSFTSSWTVRLAKAKGITFTAVLVAVGRKGATEISSTATRSVTFSVG